MRSMVLSQVRNEGQLTISHWPERLRAVRSQPESLTADLDLESYMQLQSPPADAREVTQARFLKLSTTVMSPMFMAAADRTLLATDLFFSRADSKEMQQFVSSAARRRC